MAIPLSTKYKERLKENEADSLYAYLAKNGAREEEGYYDTVGKAETVKSLSDTNYGARASSLASSGLSGSGYEDYLSSLNEKSYKESVANAERTREADKYRNVSGYEKYLSDYDALQSKISSNVISSIITSGSFSLDAAYKAAVDAGISKEYALNTASEGVRLAKEAAAQEAITFAKLNGLSPSVAEKYAKSLGLDDTYAKLVYNEISTFTEEEKDYYSSMSADGYYDYIMSQANK